MTRLDAAVHGPLAIGGGNRHRQDRRNLIDVLDGKRLSGSEA
jgi:hypothetical protein